IAGPEAGSLQIELIRPPQRASTMKEPGQPGFFAFWRPAEPKMPVPVCEVVNKRFPAGVLRMSVGRETGDLPMRNEFVGSTPRLSAGRPSRNARSTSDEALIEKIASGNRLAMQALFIRHQTRIYRFILRLVARGTLAEDCA